MEEAREPLPRSFKVITAIFSIIIGLVVYAYITAPSPPPPPPLYANMTFVGVDNTTFIYVISITPQNSPFWHTYSTATIYAINTYTGSIAVNCIVKPPPPINITKNEYTLYITLLCPMAITNTTIATNNGTIIITPPSPS